jgi:two-component system cell cycle sensor histidine kinase/response regulator CckA
MLEISKKDTVYKDLGDIQVAAERAADLTRQLLLFSRKQSMKFTVVNVNKTIRDLLKMLKRLIGENIKVVTKMENDLWAVRADRGTLEQIIMNLAINARDAMQEGGKLTVETANVRLDAVQCESIPESRPGKCIRLSVSDTGLGMDKETVKHIFEPFFSTKGVGKGTGLGLSVVYGIVKEHGGWIQVFSRPGEGTTFHIYIPADLKKHNEEIKRKIPVEKLEGKGRRILVVEDEERVREFAINCLDRSGYVVFGASDAREASTIFEEENGNFHVILSDVVLPDKSGIDMVNEFLSHRPEIGVLFSSGYTDYQSRWPRIQEKGFRFLEKPYALNDLLRVIKEVSA